jgi:hypothetical protein
MKKINHHIYKQKDLHEYWSSDWGWLHIGDLVQWVSVSGFGSTNKPFKHQPDRPQSGMVTGFFYDPAFEDGTTIVGVLAAHDQQMRFIPSNRCRPTGAL